MCLKTNLKYILLFIGVFCMKNIVSTITWIECDLIKFENAEGGLLRSNMKVERLNKTTFGLSGTLEILEDFSNDWEFEGVIYNSVNGNNQFVKTPYKIPKAKVCDMIDGIFTKSGAAKMLADVSDLPEPIPNESLCRKCKKGTYTLGQYLISKDIIPRFFHAGYYKVQGISKKDDLTTMWQLYFKLY